MPVTFHIWSPVLSPAQSYDTAIMYYFHYTDKTTESERLSDLLNTTPTIGAECNYKVHANTRPLHTAAGLIDSSVLHPAFASQASALTIRSFLILIVQLPQLLTKDNVKSAKDPLLSKTKYM